MDKAAETGLGAAPLSKLQGPRPGGASTAFARPQVLSTRETGPEARAARDKQKGACAVPARGAPALSAPALQGHGQLPGQACLGLDGHLQEPTQPDFLVP